MRVINWPVQGGSGLYVGWGRHIAIMGRYSYTGF